jgi:hypothetical protein
MATDGSTAVSRKTVGKVKRRSAVNLRIRLEATNPLPRAFALEHGPPMTVPKVAGCRYFLLSRPFSTLKDNIPKLANKFVHKNLALIPLLEGDVVVYAR